MEPRPTESTGSALIHQASGHLSKTSLQSTDNSSSTDYSTFKKNDFLHSTPKAVRAVKTNGLEPQFLKLAAALPNVVGMNTNPTNVLNVPSFTYCGSIINVEQRYGRDHVKYSWLEL